MSTPLRVIVVDDHDDFRNTLVALLSDLDGVTVVGQGRSGEEAARLVREHRPDVAIVDLKMPVTGWVAIEAVRLARPATRIIVVTAASEEDRHRALRDGADAVVSKSSPDLRTQVVDALGRVTGRGRLI
jgi:DNA-binding NarL/FixJ family response regulator